MEGMELFWEPGESVWQFLPLWGMNLGPPHTPMEVHGSASDLKERAMDFHRIHTKVTYDYYNRMSDAQYGTWA